MEAVATPQITRVSVNKGITLTQPVIGRIAMGHTVLRDDKALPVKDDHFTLTTLVQDRETRVWEEHPIQQTHSKADEKLRAIPVRIAYNDVNLNLNNSYTAFDPKKGRVLCTGNGVRARRATEDGVEEIDCPRPEACEYGQRQRCKNFSRAYFRVEGQEDELGTFILRTTSYNSLDRLGSRLNQLSGLTGGRIAGMPMMLVMTGKSTTQSFRDAIQFADLVTRPGMNLISAVKEANDYQATMSQAGLSLDNLEIALRAGLANSAFADELEDVDEWLTDEDLIDAVGQQQGQRNTGLRGMDSLTERLSLLSQQNEEKGAEANAELTPPGQATGPESAEGGGELPAQQELIAV
ncbi:MAG: hypothetical protein FD131_3267 [Rhodocyclaceae bacterium]|nr:MAG: hypothetical protein FD131_3267 [Rhodocyclaceae bacterium]